MIADMMKLKNICIMEEVHDWKEAIHISLEPLLRGGFITENYEKAILECTEKYGPYYVLAENFALIHGRPGVCTSDTGLSGCFFGTSG